MPKNGKSYVSGKKMNFGSDMPKGASKMSGNLGTFKMSLPNPGSHKKMGGKKGSCGCG